MRKRAIVVTESDESRLRELLEDEIGTSLRDQVHLRELQSELERAMILKAKDVPGEVITMHSRIRVLDLNNGRRNDFMLVFPSEADVEAKQISVLAPMGTALLGFRQGDEVEWTMPGGVRRLRVERVRQPSMVDRPQGMARWPLHSAATSLASS